MARLWRAPPPFCRLVALALVSSLAVALLTALALGTEMDGWRRNREASRHPATAAAAPALGPALDGPAAPQAPLPPASDREQAEAEAERLVEEMRQHVAQHGPAGFFWPAGCRWRDKPGLAPRSGACDPATMPKRGMAFGGFEAVWRCHGYEWSDEAGQAWTVEQPAACRLQTVPMHEWVAAMAQLRFGNASALAGGARPGTWAQQEVAQGQNSTAAALNDALGSSSGGSGSSGDSGTSGSLAAAAPAFSSSDVASQVRCATGYCIIKNLWYRGGRFFFLQDPASPTRLEFAWQLGRNRQGAVLSVADAAEFAAGVGSARVVPGETVLLDWTFFMHPTALGHWLEALMPLFSYLRHEPLVRRTPDRVLVLFQQRANINDWVRGVMAAALGVAPGAPLPPLLFQREVASPLQQPQQVLEGLDSEWIMFDQVLWPRDVFNGGNRGCLDGADARLLRQLLHTMHGTRLPPPGAAPPATITLQRKSANRRIVNEGEVVAMLREFGEVRVVEYGADSTLREQLEMAAGTGLYLSVHTSNLANALWLPPGAAVVEILQRNWAWEDIDQFFWSLTKQLGDVHHYAIRAQGLNETLHRDPRLARLFGNWTAEQCQDQGCVESLTHVDIRVDVEALRQLVAGRLVAIRSGASVAEAALPWPRLPDPPPASAKAQAPAGQRLVARLLDSGAPEQLPDVAAVWAHLRRP